MTRIVCPHCHAPLSSNELEQVTLAGHLCLVCPECSTVLVSEPLDAPQPAQRFAGLSKEIGTQDHSTPLIDSAAVLPSKMLTR